MKKYQYFLAFMLLLLIAGCKKDITTEGVSRLTTYLRYELTGGSVVTVPQGNTFSDPGFKAYEGQKDASANVTVEGNVDGMQVGLYTLTYTGKNSDGYSSSTQRTVIVYSPDAPATDFSGAYLSDVRRVSPARSFSGLDVTITRLAPGFFYVSDFLGGFYDQGSNYLYGPTFAMTGYMLLNADNTIELVSSHLAGWGDSLNDLTNGTYDPVTGTISWDAFYTANNYNFKVTLTKASK